MILIRGHGFVEMHVLHSLNCRHDFGSSETHGESAPQCRARDVELINVIESRLKSYQIIGRFRLFVIAIYTIMV